MMMVSSRFTVSRDVVPVELQYKSPEVCGCVRNCSSQIGQQMAAIVFLHFFVLI